jgi:hypothetical protein
LALYIATEQLSHDAASTHHDTFSDMNLDTEQKRLHVLMQAVDGFYPEYNAAQWVEQTARYAANFAQSYNQVLSSSGEESMRD